MEISLNNIYSSLDHWPAAHIITTISAEELASTSDQPNHIKSKKHKFNNNQILQETKAARESLSINPHDAKEKNKQEQMRGKGQ